MSDVILFDLDGTLTDSGTGIIKCVQYALNYMGKPEGDADKLRCFVGPPLHKEFMEYAGFTSKEADKAVEQYRERYSTIGIYENRVYDEIPELLTSLKKQGKTLAVASSKPGVFVEEVLKHFDLKKYFDIVVGSELDGRRVEKEEVIEEVLKRLGISKNRERVLMVGDRSYDVEGARKCGLLCVGAAYGYGSREELQKAGAVYVADTVQDLSVLAQTDEEETEKTSFYKPHRKKHAKQREHSHSKNQGRRNRGSRRIVSPGRMIWEILSPMVVHFICMMAVSTLGVTIAEMFFHGEGRDYMDTVERFPWLSSILSAVTALVVIFLLRSSYLVEKDKFQIKVKRWNPLTAAACAVTSIGLGLIVTKLIDASGIRGVFSRYAQISENSYENQNQVLLVICVGILASLGEELVFRGLIYQRAKSYFGVGWAVGISAALFGVYHGNIVQLLYATVLGILFAVLYEKTGTLAAPVTAHIATNIFSIFYDRIVDALIRRARYGEQLLIVFAVLLAAAGCYYLFFYKPGTLEKTEKHHIAAK